MPEGNVNGTVVQGDAYGTIQGTPGASNTISTGAGDDRMQGQGAFNQYYGGAGNDTFILNAKFALQSGAHDGASTAYGDQFGFVTDFQGAGGWFASNNDFMALVGFGSGATLNMVGTGTSGTSSTAKVYYYNISWTDTGGTSHVTNFAMNSVNGNALSSNDYAFY